jgi:hypothetical protein
VTVMFAKLIGLMLLVVGVFVGFSILVALIGTAIGLLFFVLKIAVPVALVYLGYRLLCSDRSRYA